MWKTEQQCNDGQWMTFTCYEVTCLPFTLSMTLTFHHFYLFECPWPFEWLSHCIAFICLHFLTLSLTLVLAWQLFACPWPYQWPLPCMTATYGWHSWKNDCISVSLTLWVTLTPSMWAACCWHSWKNDCMAFISVSLTLWVTLTLHDGCLLLTQLEEWLHGFHLLHKKQAAQRRHRLLIEGCQLEILKQDLNERAKSLTFIIFKVTFKDVLHLRGKN